MRAGPGVARRVPTPIAIRWAVRHRRVVVLAGRVVTVPPGEWDKSVRLGFEREMLGLYVSDHPLFGVEHVLVGAADMSIATLHADGAADGQTVTVAGILSGVNRRVTKAGAPWAQVVLEDLEGGLARRVGLARLRVRDGEDRAAGRGFPLGAFAVVFGTHEATPLTTWSAIG